MAREQARVRRRDGSQPPAAAVGDRLGIGCASSLGHPEGAAPRRLCTSGCSKLEAHPRVDEPPSETDCCLAELVENQCHYINDVCPRLVPPAFLLTAKVVHLRAADACRMAQVRFDSGPSGHTTPLWL